LKSNGEPAIGFNPQAGTGTVFAEVNRYHRSNGRRDAKTVPVPARLSPVEHRLSKVSRAGRKRAGLYKARPGLQ